MAVKFGVLALLAAKSDKAADLERFLESGRSIALAEEGTVTWYAFRISDTAFGIFDTFDSEEGLQAHLAGEIPAALAEAGPDLLSKDPDLRTVEIVAAK
jgi:quinol monooxygenase YgiN